MTIKNSYGKEVNFFRDGNGTLHLVADPGAEHLRPYVAGTATMVKASELFACPQGFDVPCELYLATCEAVNLEGYLTENFPLLHGLVWKVSGNPWQYYRFVEPVMPKPKENYFTLLEECSQDLWLEACDPNTASVGAECPARERGGVQTVMVRECVRVPHTFLQRPADGTVRQVTNAARTYVRGSWVSGKENYLPVEEFLGTLPEPEDIAAHRPYAKSDLPA